jgi:hypothetical protein
MLRDSGANISFAPADFRGFEPLMEALAPRVMTTAAARPDDGGKLSLSLHAGAFIDELHRAGADPDRLLVVEVSDAFPRTLGAPPEHPHALEIGDLGRRQIAVVQFEGLRSCLALEASRSGRGRPFP